MCTYGPTVGANLGYASVHHADGVTDSWIEGGDWTINPNFLGPLPATVGRTPWFDPTRSRTRVELSVASDGRRQRGLPRDRDGDGGRSPALANHPATKISR